MATAKEGMGCRWKWKGWVLASCLGKEKEGRKGRFDEGKPRGDFYCVISASKLGTGSVPTPSGLYFGPMGKTTVGSLNLIISTVIKAEAKLLCES